MQASGVQACWSGDADVVGAPRLLVSRMLARAMVEPGLQDAMAQKLGKLATEAPPITRTLPGEGPAEAQVGMVSERPAQISEACRRLLYVCLFASANAHATAQQLLLRYYQRAGRRRLDQDELILPLVYRFCGPIEWARSAVVCQSVRSRGLDHHGLLTYWFNDYSREGRKEALKHAIQHNVIGLLRPLIEARAEVNCVFEQCFFRAPLHRAASRGHREVCKLLLALQADASLRDSHGAAPIHLVASKGRLPIVDLLLRHDSGSASAVDYSGRTPCHMAALKGHLLVVQRLVAAHASVGSQTIEGRTPLDMARRGQHFDIVRYLESLRRRRDHEEEALPAARHVLHALFHRTFVAARRRA